jgi:hypothetical protein
MMEKDDFLQDDFLRDLIRRSPLDSPANDFVDRVMAGITESTEPVVVKKPFYVYLKSGIPYVMVAFLLILVTATSDLRIFSWLPGHETLISQISAYFTMLAGMFKSVFASRYVSWGLLVTFSAGILFVIDRLFSQRKFI